MNAVERLVFDCLGTLGDMEDEDPERGLAALEACTAPLSAVSPGCRDAF